MYPTLKVSKMGGGPVLTNDEDDNYISATMVVPEVWKPVAKQVTGELLVAFPARNRVFAIGSADPDAVRAFAKVVHVAFTTEDHPIADTIFRWSAPGWMVHAEQYERHKDTLSAVYLTTSISRDIRQLSTL